MLEVNWIASANAVTAALVALALKVKVQAVPLVTEAALAEPIDVAPYSRVVPLSQIPLLLVGAASACRWRCCWP